MEIFTYLRYYTMCVSDISIDSLPFWDNNHLWIYMKKVTRWGDSEERLIKKHNTDDISQSNLYSTCIKRAILTLFSTSMISRKESRNLWEITRLISSIFHVSKESDYWKISGTIGNKIWKEKVSAIWYLLASNFILFLQNGKICQNFLFLVKWYFNVYR